MPSGDRLDELEERLTLPKCSLLRLKEVMIAFSGS